MVNVNKDNISKCEEYGYWHRRATGFLYCVCCLYGKCDTIPEENRIIDITTEEN